MRIDELVNYVPTLTFAEFKWKWACYAPTEGINDPVVLLGILFRMAKLEGRYKYSSDEFASELIQLSNDLKGSGVNIDLENRTGERNIIRNSGQYWKALNLIPKERTGGIITLTPFGRKVANHVISQTEFSAETIASFTLPNNVSDQQEKKLWNNAGLKLYPLKLILSIVNKLADWDYNEAYITPYELAKIIVPLSGVVNQPLNVYVDCIKLYRENRLNIVNWPNCCPEANDFRMVREFLLFLSNYGYLIQVAGENRESEKYDFNFALKNEIETIIKSRNEIGEGVISDAERKLVTSTRYRPNQARFRKEVLRACRRCVISNVEMPEVLEAAHIKPYRYNGADTADNGFAMRMDIHFLFDSGHLRISENGDVFLSEKARWSYGASIPPRIFIPDHINREYLRWRWDNYNGA